MLRRSLQPKVFDQFCVPSPRLELGTCALGGRCAIRLCHEGSGGRRWSLLNTSHYSIIGLGYRGVAHHPYLRGRTTSPAPVINPGLAVCRSGHTFSKSQRAGPGRTLIVEAYAASATSRFQVAFSRRRVRRRILRLWSSVQHPQGKRSSAPSIFSWVMTRTFLGNSRDRRSPRCRATGGR